jgi:hypothetical protein
MLGKNVDLSCPPPSGLLLAQNVMPHLMGHLLFDEFIFIFSI